MSFLSRILGSKKSPDPLDALDEPIEIDEEETGLFITDATQRPASVALRSQQPAEAPVADETDEDETEVDDAIDEIAEPAELLPQSPRRAEASEAREAVVDVADIVGEGEAGVAEDAPEAEQGAGEQEPAEGSEGDEEPAAVAEVQTIAAPKDGDALSMFRSTGANSELTALTEGLEDEDLEGLLTDAREISSWLKKGAA